MSGYFISDALDRMVASGFNLHAYAGKRVLVTGGAGFIGSFLVEALIKLGSEVFVVDNLWRGTLDNLKRTDGSSWINLQDHFILGDLQDSRVAYSVFQRSNPEIVFHLADIVAGVDYVFANEPYVFRANNLINSNVFTAAAELGVQKMIYLGTACSYPQALQKKTGGAPLVEDQIYPADPESAYGWSKLMGEYELELIGKNSTMQTGILRLHNVYGPHSVISKKRSQVIPSLIRKAICYPAEEMVVWGSGRQTRDFIYVGDVVDAMLRVGIVGMNQGAIQIASGCEVSISELTERIVKISSKDIHVTYDIRQPEGDVGRSGNYDKARRILDWKPFTSLEEGLRLTYEWMARKITLEKVNLDE